MAEFNPGDWVIDTQRETVPTIIGVLGGDFIEQLYVLEDDDTNEIYVSKESNLQHYK